MKSPDAWIRYSNLTHDMFMQHLIVTLKFHDKLLCGHWHEMFPLFAWWKLNINDMSYNYCLWFSTFICGPILTKTPIFTCHEVTDMQSFYTLRRDCSFHYLWSSQIGYCHGSLPKNLLWVLCPNYFKSFCQMWPQGWALSSVQCYLLP